MMKKSTRKLAVLLVVSMLACVFGRICPAQAASAWTFSVGEKKNIPVNGVVILGKDEQPGLALYKNGKEIKDDNATYSFSWQSSDPDVVWVNQMGGNLHTDKYDEIKTDMGVAKITALIRNRKSGDTAKRSFYVIVEEKEVSKPTATPVQTTTDAPIQPLAVVRNWPELSGVDGVMPYGEFWIGNSDVKADLSAEPALAYSLTFSDETGFDALPAGYDPEELLEWGKYPGLNVDILHKYGFTGKGATIAYVDQPIAEHEQYDDLELHYTNNTTSEESMHGPAVLSLLAGEETGTAPEVNVYFYGFASWEADQTRHAECLYQIIEQNKKLKDGEKITMVGFSDNIDPSEKNTEAFEEAVLACEEAGIMVWFCGEYGSGVFLPLSDRNDYRNLINDQWSNSAPELVVVPAGSRTTAATLGDSDYIYWSSGGLSWTMPYVLGLYAIAIQINPELTQDDLRALIVDTAYRNQDMPIVNPVGFVAEVLKGVGRTEEAQTLLDAVNARLSYLYAVMDTAAMSQEDMEAVGEYLASITDATVLVADAAAFANAGELYAALQKDAQERGGKTVGVQIFGTTDMVPAFRVQYKVQMTDSVDDGGMFLSDLFYGNFDNDAEEIASGYNVCDHFENGWDVELAPDWPVARLPLSKGEFSAFLEKYEDFVTDTGLERQRLVNFSNPIFSSVNHTDDMGAFLNRMNEEFGMLDVPYSLYGNQKGDYPVTTEVLGGFTAKNLSSENKKGIAEFIINSHGQSDNIDNCYFENGKEIRSSFVNTETINNVLSDNPYYLDCWTCNNGWGMQDNLTTTALDGNCVGMFSATTIISNNGVNCNADVEDMKKSNFYYFYFSYLKALHEGETRSTAFCTAQRAYAEALLEDSKNEIRGEGNYQFNLCNLLAYHNFGILEPNCASAAFEAKGYIAQAGQSVPKDAYEQRTNGQGSMESDILVTDGKPVGVSVDVPWADNDSMNSGIEMTVHSCKAQKLDNGYIRFAVDVTALQREMYFNIFNPPSGNVFNMHGKTMGGHETFTFDVKSENVPGEITMNIRYGEGAPYFLYFLIKDTQLFSD